jgi:glutathione S-transferase
MKSCESANTTSKSRKSEMPDYDLYYWSIPFRGQFVRATLAFAGKTWTEKGDAAISKLMEGPVKKMPVPFMGPPLLIDKRANFAISQMPAIMLYLAETLDLMPKSPSLRAMTIKVVNDANDVIDEITQDGGREMWTKKSWKEFIPRLKKWMSLWEEVGVRHGLTTDSGFLLGGDEAGVVDVVTATLWSTMIDHFDDIGAMLQDAAPITAGLTKRVADLSQLKKLAAKSKRNYGDVYSGGKIEASLRKVVNA